ncbi:hypothetical protein [Leifsonia xyli]|nr:hypothetical protein [Leifsonia xyli]
MTVRLTAATLTRPFALEAVCVRCIRAVGLGDEYAAAIAMHRNRQRLT